MSSKVFLDVGGASNISLFKKRLFNDPRNSDIWLLSFQRPKWSDWNWTELTKRNIFTSFDKKKKPKKKRTSRFFKAAVVF